MDDVEAALMCLECGWDLEEDDGELSCSNFNQCNSQLDAEERMLKSTLPNKRRRSLKPRGRPTPITEAYLVDLIRRGRYKQFLQRRRNKR